MEKLDQIAVVDLSGCSSIADMAARDGDWSPDRYAAALSENIRSSGMSLDVHRERLAGLAQVGVGVGAGLAGDQASADELARHFSILEALFHRFAKASIDAADSGRSRASETAERYLKASMIAQRSAMACLSALKALRDSQRPESPTTAATVSAPATLAVPMSSAK